MHSILLNSYPRPFFFACLFICLFNVLAKIKYRGGLLLSFLLHHNAI